MPELWGRVVRFAPRPHGVRDARSHVETPQVSTAATTETSTAKPDGNAGAAPGAESAPAAKGPSEQERINELTGNWRDAQRDRDFWRDQALNGRGRQQEAPDNARGNGNQRTDEPAEEPVKTLKDFNYDEAAHAKYLRDLVRNEVRRENDGFRAEMREGQTKAQRAEAVDDFADRATKWAAEQKVDKPDLMFAKPEDGGPYVTELMADAMLDSQHGPEILNFLTRNRDESRRICRLPPLQQAREIGRLEAKFANPPAARTDSGAPPPASQVKGASEHGTGKKDAADMSDSEWYADKQRRERARK